MYQKNNHIPGFYLGHEAWLGSLGLIDWWMLIFVGLQWVATLGPFVESLESCPPPPPLVTQQKGSQNQKNTMQVDSIHNSSQAEKSSKNTLRN